MKVTIEKGELIIRMPVSDPPVPSKSGKSLVVATTRGNVEADFKVNGKPLYIGMNAYIKA